MSQPKGNDKTARQTEASQDDDQRNPEHDTGGLGAFGGQSQSAGNIENKASNSISQRRDSTRHIDIELGEIFGGMLRQLIVENGEQLADYRSKLAEYQSKIEKLEHKRLQLRELYEELQGQASTNENEQALEEE